MEKLIKAFLPLSIIVMLAGCASVTAFLSSTSSTSDAITPDISVNEFVNKRYAAIRHDAANGGGENLDALAQLLGRDDADAFANQMQVNFDQIFFDVKDPSDIIARIESQTKLHNG